jgi:hypothetical protein|tara:strand:+ start:78 stop:542 length:465 start_codon:yes stop_codon:yes gene_type:complete
MASVENYVPYQPNAQGLTEVLLDLKSTMPSQVVAKVTGYVTNCFEDVTQGDAVYSRASDGFIGKAIANDTEQKAQVAGFAETTKSSGSEVRVLTRGIIATSGLDTGDLYFLSAASAGSIVTTPPSTAGQYVTRVGEAGSTGQFIIKVEPPIKLS